MFRFLLLSRVQKQASLFVREAQLADSLSRVSGDDQRRKHLDSLLQPFARFERPIRLPLSPAFVVDGVNVAKCKVMSSNAAPVLVRFSGMDNINPAVIVKSGDDLRQDEFAMLFARLLNSLFTGAGISARVVTYNVVSTMRNCGMIELVERCKTVGAIQGGVGGALKKELLSQHLVSLTSPSCGWNDLMKNFVETLAGEDKTKKACFAF
jgi:phosphatidylinositol kinase/protein kinase (PI-3  family)